MEYNIVEIPIIPENPKIVPNEQLHVYVPKATFGTPGVITPSYDFVIEQGKLKIGANHPRYDENGNIIVGSPENLDDAVNLRYLNENTVLNSNESSVLYGTDEDGKSCAITYSETEENDTIVKRDGKGRINVYHPTLNSHAVNLGYLNARLNQFELITIVDTLPDTGLPNKIYLVPKSDTQQCDLFDEYLWINGKWEWVTTKQLEIDLSPYATKSDVKEFKDYSHNTFANALKGKSSGAIVALDDVSPLEHKVKVKLSGDMADNTAVTLTVCGQNILKYPFANSSKELNGIVYTDNGDGTITVNGTATSDSTFDVNRTGFISNSEESVSFILSGCPSGGSANTYHLRNTSTGHMDTGSGLKTTAYVRQLGVRIFIKGGTTVNNLVFKPQLVITNSNTIPPYEAYKGETITTTLAEGVELPNNAPNMTIFTDNTGVVVEAEYNRDSNIVIEKLTQAIISLGGNI